MDKKTAFVLSLLIVFGGVVSLGALWFAPFQDSQVIGKVTSKVHISNVTIPLESIARLVQPKTLTSTSQSTRAPLEDMVLGAVSIDIEVNGDVKNLEKLLRGILMPNLRQSSYSPSFYPNWSNWSGTGTEFLQIGLNAGLMVIIVLVTILVGIVLVRVSIKLFAHFLLLQRMHI